MENSFDFIENCIGTLKNKYPNAIVEDDIDIFGECIRVKFKDFLIEIDFDFDSDELVLFFVIRTGGITITDNLDYDSLENLIFGLEGLIKYLSAKIPQVVGEMSA